ncbi:hypothetical protein RCH07_000075 [Arthrobacter sp. CG_A4]|nr:hypothetical protein [Arthrobacter sp. CG_A4]
MLTVSHDPPAVESDLAGRRLTCPGCAGVLAPWGWARVRLIRHGRGAGAGVVEVRPRRGRCTGCAGTHVLLGVEFAARRADPAAVIAAAIEAKVVGSGHRTIAGLLGRPVSTVRGWLRGFTACAAAVVEACTALAHCHGADAAGVWPAPVPALAGRAVGVVAAYASVLAQRFSVAVVDWHAAGPWFFSARWWQGREQHELALMPVVAAGQGGRSTG